jgi:hypothetical protein
MHCFLNVGNAQIVEIVVLSVLTHCMTVNLRQSFGTSVEAIRSSEASVSTCNPTLCHKLTKVCDEPI